MTSQTDNMTSYLIFFDFVLFVFSILVAGPSYMSISSLVLELCQFSVIRDWAEIRKPEIPVWICPISGDWSELRIPNLTQMSIIKWCCWMMQNISVTGFTVSELLSENQQGTEEGGSSTQIMVKNVMFRFTFILHTLKVNFLTFFQFITRHYRL